jgi:hypothetical protein
MGKEQGARKHHSDGRQMEQVVQPAIAEGSIDLKGPVLFSGREEREEEMG